MKIWYRVKPLGKLTRLINQKIVGIQIHPKCQYLMNMELLVVHLFYHPKKILEIWITIKSLENWGEQWI